MNYFRNGLVSPSREGQHFPWRQNWRIFLSQEWEWLLSIGRDGQLYTSIHDKRDDFDFHITNFPFLSSNIPYMPAYGVFIFQLKRYARAFSSYKCFILRARRLSSKVFKQGLPQGMFEIVIQEVLWSIRGSYLAIWRIPLTNVKWHSDPWPTVTSQLISLSANFMILIPNLTFTKLRVVSMEHLQRAWHAIRERLHFRTPGSVLLLATCLCSSCWDQIPWTCHVLLDFSPWIPLGTFSILLVIPLDETLSCFQMVRADTIKFCEFC